MGVTKCKSVVESVKLSSTILLSRLNLNKKIWKGTQLDLKKQLNNTVLFEYAIDGIAYPSYLSHMDDFDLPVKGNKISFFHR